MKPIIVDRPQLLLAGISVTGKNVTEIDIYGLWQIYTKSEPAMNQRIDGFWYELHVGTELGNGIYSVFIGAEVRGIGNLPVELSLKVIPEGKYAHFAHCLKDGGYGAAFAGVEQWVKQTGTPVKDFGLQVYDINFNPADQNSVLNIYIPLK